LSSIQEFFTSRKKNVVGSTYVGNSDRLWYEPDTNVIKVSDGITPGGIVVGGAGGGSYILPTASTVTKGGVRIDNSTIVIDINGVISVKNGVYTTESYANPSWITSLPYSKITGSPTNISAFTNDVGYATLTEIQLSGGTDNQILVKKSGTDYDYQWEELIIDPIYTKLIDDTIPDTMYLGEAVPNSIETAPVWRIQRIDFDSNGNVDSVRFAASGQFTQVWNNRASLTYI
jgi:hypothetical protein